MSPEHFTLQCFPRDHTGWEFEFPGDCAFLLVGNISDELIRNQDLFDGLHVARLKNFGVLYRPSLNLLRPREGDGILLGGLSRYISHSVHRLTGPPIPI